MYSYSVLDNDEFMDFRRKNHIRTRLRDTVTTVKKFTIFTVLLQQTTGYWRPFFVVCTESPDADLPTIDAVRSHILSENEKSIKDYLLKHGCFENAFH